MVKPLVTRAINVDEIAHLCEGVPPVLRLPLEEAVALFNEVVAGQEPCWTWQQWVEPFRNPPPMGLIGIYPDRSGDFFNALLRLYNAIVKIENFNPKDHYSKGVDRVAQGMRSRGKGGRKPIIEPDKIVAWLKRRDYQRADNKKALVIEATERFGVSQSTVRAVASEAGLTRPKAVKN